MTATCHRALLFGLCLGLATTAEARTFKYKNGRSVEGELVGLAGNQATLVVDGRPQKLALDRFAAAEQKFIRESVITKEGPLPSTAPPSDAIEAGYRLRTFATEFRPETVDVRATSASGFQWYPWNFFGRKTDLSKIRLNGDGSVTLLGDSNTPNGQLATIVPVKAKNKFVGTGLGGGGYFEATFKFDPQTVIKTNFKGWPSWWSMAVEMALNMDASLWPGQPGEYRHAVEADFFEYDLGAEVAKGLLNVYGGCMHDWHGVWAENKKYLDAKTGAPGYRDNMRIMPPDTNLNEYHQYGFLWVPATATTKGYAKYYFDRKEIGKGVSWEQYNNQPPPPAPPWLFSIIDKHHRILILGTGADQPMTIKSVDVWQKNGEQNVRN